MLALFSVVIASARAFGGDCPGPAAADLRATQWNGEVPRRADPMPANFRLAIFGDQAYTENSFETLRFVKDWAPDLLLHLGDFDYQNDPSGWNAMLDEVLGEDFPMLAIRGNHDMVRWREYKDVLEDRLLKTNITCFGEIGVDHFCHYKGVYVAGMGMGLQGTGHVEFGEDALSSHFGTWKICTWHNNQRAYQIGSKRSSTGYEIYDMCREQGAAFLATAHEHSYSRTHLMSNFALKEIASTNNTLVTGPGEAFVFVSGLAGRSIRGVDGDLDQNPWWGATAASDNGVNYGALFCILNVDGDLDRATCEFRDISGTVWDSFEVQSTLPNDQPAPPAPTPRCVSPSFDFPAVEDSFQTSDGVLVAESGLLPLASPFGERVILRFAGMDGIGRGAEIAVAHLQFLGASDADDANPPLLEIVGLADGTETAAKVLWDATNAEWDAGDVWSSPDVAPILRELAAVESWADDVTLVLRGKYPETVSVYSRDKDRCFAPSLYVEMEACSGN